jgi:hypothetical protein
MFVHATTLVPTSSARKGHTGAYPSCAARPDRLSIRSASHHGVWNFTTREFYSPEFYYPLFGIVGYIGRYIESNFVNYDEEFYYP